MTVRGVAAKKDKLLELVLFIHASVFCEQIRRP